MPPERRPDAGHARLEAILATPTGCTRSSGTAFASRPSSRTARSAPGPAASRTPRPISRTCSRRRPGSTPDRPSSTARSSPSTTTAAPTSRSSRPSSASRGRRGARLPAVRPALSRRPIAARRPARGSQAPAQERHPRPPAGPLRVARRGRGPGVLRGGQGPRSRGDGRQAPSQPLRARPPLERVAQVQDPARAGAGHRRLDAGRGERPRPRARWWSATTRTASCGSPARSGPGSPAPGGQGAARSGCGHSSRTTRRSTRRHRRTTRAAGAATSVP